MQNEEFNKIVEEVTESIKKVLVSKAKEYAHGDRLYNFKRASKITNKSTIECAKGMWMKHLVSILDILDGKLENTREMVNEKFIDSINYHILMMAILQENRKKDVNYIEVNLLDNGGK